MCYCILGAYNYRQIYRIENRINRVFWRCTSASLCDRSNEWLNLHCLQSSTSMSILFQECAQRFICIEHARLPASFVPIYLKCRLAAIRSGATTERMNLYRERKMRFVCVEFVDWNEWSELVSFSPQPIAFSVAKQHIEPKINGVCIERIHYIR